MNFIPPALQQKVRKGVYALKGLSETEQLILEATDKEKWGPHGEQLKSIAQKTVDEEEGRTREQRDESDTRIILRVLFENRLKKRDLEWRLCYKALTVIDFLIANGSETIVREIKRRIGRDLQPLKTFEHRDPEKGRDEGINIRQKVSNIIALLEDQERVKEVREKARMNRGKYKGMSNADLKAGSLNWNNTMKNADANSNTGLKSTNDSVSSTTKIATTAAATTAPQPNASSGTSAMSNVLNAFEDDEDGNDDGDDNGEFMGGGGHQQSKGPPSFVPKVVIRDTPVERPSNSAGFSATLKPPPKGGNAFVSAGNNTGFENRPPNNAGKKPSTASPTISLDDLLGGGGGIGTANQSSSSGTPYQSAEDLFGFEANVSKPAQQRPRAPAVPTGTVAIDDLFFGMETTPTASIAQPAVMPKQQQQMDPFSDFASSSAKAPPPKINQFSSTTTNKNNRNTKVDPLDALDFGSLGLK